MNGLVRHSDGRRGPRSRSTSESTVGPEPSGRIGLIGGGKFGHFCVDAYRRAPDLRLVAIADAHQDALQSFRDSGYRLELDWRRLLEIDEIEVIHLATPPFLRRDMAVAALEAGKSVFCEKPLALSLDEADEIIATAERTRRALGLDYVMRHHPAYHLAGRLASSGIMGEPRTVDFYNFAQSMPVGHWFWDRELSGGILVEHGVHFFDAYGQILGEAAETRGTYPRPEAVDVSVSYRSGALAHFYHEFAFPRQVESTSGTLAFTKGHLRLNGWIPTRLDGAVLGSQSHLAEAVDGLALAKKSESDGAVHFMMDFPDREEHYRRAIVAGMRDVLHCHRDTAYPITVSLNDARSSLALALAATRAAETGEAIRL